MLAKPPKNRPKPMRKPDAKSKNLLKNAPKLKRAIMPPQRPLRLLSLRHQWHPRP